MRRFERFNRYAESGTSGGREEVDGDFETPLYVLLQSHSKSLDTIHYSLPAVAIPPSILGR